MEVQQYIRTVKENWWIILAALLGSLALGIAYSYAQTPIYEASATFSANPSVSIADTDDQVRVLDTLTRRSGLVSSYCVIMQSELIREQALTALGVTEGLAEPYEIQCVVLPDSSILSLSADGPSPYLARDLVNAVGAAGLNYVGGLQEIFELRSLDHAKVEITPISPNHLINISLAAILGLMGGAGFVILRQALMRSAIVSLGGAIVDPSSGIATLDYLRQRLEEEIRRAQIQNYPLSLAVIEFEPLDDLSNYPIHVVQQLRRQLAVFLQDRSRKIDLVAYVQDNMFGILMPEINGMEARDAIADVMGDLRVKVFGVNDLGISVAYQGSAGIVESNGGNIEWRRMINMGQEAVQNANAEGPYQVHLTRTTPGPFFDVLVGSPAT